MRGKSERSSSGIWVQLKVTGFQSELGLILRAYILICDFREFVMAYFEGEGISPPVSNDITALRPAK